MLTFQGHKSKRGPNPPGHLSDAMKKWWRRVLADYELDDHHRHLLENAASSWDRAEQARVILAAEGLTAVDSKGVIHAHPCVGIEINSRKLYNACLRELGLDVRSAEPVRPPYLPAYTVKKGIAS